MVSCEFRPDDTTQEVIETVHRQLPDLPGSIETFQWPVTREEALAALRHFIEHRLPQFGEYQDAMIPGEPFMFHSLLSGPLNLKLLNPRECIDKALETYESGGLTTGHGTRSSSAGHCPSSIGLARPT